ncbi:MAG: DNA repair protein RecO [Melioribacteraceae bacterium]|nr:DNA repair protein RecO [Melioribacteraceae bacterium]MCF8355195.1 DNA repair protein RecO [Melioribacteraceae bacterium]MCF8396181.1 DNA repair protein RecO [Melioribacteraceae bacterium]MCF8419886.1 DNA repair protein RecO [Melioribacteraceae bacterium]
MSEILKTDAIVIRKLDYGDSSKILTFYSEKFGKISCIIKGARSPKSKIGAIADLLNHVHIVFYNKEKRDIQIVTQVDLHSNFTKIKDDLNKLKYASAVLELLAMLTIDHETNERLYRGSVKILKMINDSDNHIEILFVKYFIFLIEEIGYELHLERCNSCQNKLEGESVGYNHEIGFMCSNCSKDHLVNFNFGKELFDFLFCLSKKDCNTTYSDDHLNRLINFLERYVGYHVSEFKGLKSLQIY